MNGDPSFGLLAAAPPGQGERALLLGCAGSPGLVAAYAARYGETYCHVDLQPAAAALPASVRILLGDLPCCAERLPGPDEDFLPAHRFPPGHFDRIVIRPGRASAQATAALLESFRMLRIGGELLAALPNREGAKSFAKRAETVFGSPGLAALKHSCRLFRFAKRAPEPAGSIEDPGYYRSIAHSLAHPAGEIRYRTKPGVFAYRGTDPGTAALARHLPDCSGLRVLDLCCGSGALALAAFARGAAEVWASDASATALACAERNFAEAGRPGRVLLSDLGAGIPGGFDLILANPPFHEGADADYSLPGRVAAAIAAALRPGGEAWVVANQFLDYAGASRGRFASCAVAAREPGYLIHRMVMPS